MRLRPHTDDSALFDCLGDDGAVLAVGTLECEYIQGAQRHGTLQFVTARPEMDLAGSFQKSLEEQQAREAANSGGGA